MSYYFYKQLLDAIPQEFISEFIRREIPGVDPDAYAYDVFDWDYNSKGLLLAAEYIGHLHEKIKNAAPTGTA